jgi:hypothetical protein
MTPAAVCSRITLTVQISETLYDAIQISAAMSRTTVPAFIGSALRETQIAFFAEPASSGSFDVLVLDVDDSSPDLPSTPRRRGRGIGALQRAILAGLENAPNQLGVYDLAEVRRTLLHSHHGPNISRAIHELVRRGWLVPTGDGVRYVRRGAGV